MLRGRSTGASIPMWLLPKLLKLTVTLDGTTLSAPACLLSWYAQAGKAWLPMVAAVVALPAAALDTLQEDDLELLDNTV